MAKDGPETQRKPASERETASKPAPKTLQDERIQAIMDAFKRPLEKENWTATPHAGQQTKAQKLLNRIGDHRRHRQALKRARKAAQDIFKVTPQLSTRKRASLMLGAGAVGLAALAGQPTQAVQDVMLEPERVAIEQGDMEQRRPAELLRASDEFKQALIEEEGVRYTVYRDVAGYPTVGVGHLVTPEDNLRVGQTISEERVSEFLERDITIAEQGVRTLVGDLPLYQREFDALIDLVYNVGLGNVSAEESPRLNEAIAAGDYQAIADELDYTHAGGKVAKGLAYRSERRANIFTDAVYENPRDIDEENSA